MAAHNEGLSWISRRTGQWRYSANGQDQWIQPLSIYVAGEAIQRGQPVSVPVLADYNDATLPGLQAYSDSAVVLTRTNRHKYSIGLALESATIGGTVHVLESGKFSYLAANSATEYWPAIFTQYSNGSIAYAGPTPGSITFSPIEAETGGRTIIQLGTVANTATSGSTLTQVDLEVSITGDGRGPLDNTQFEFVTGEAIPYVSGIPPVCSISDGVTNSAPAGTAIVADNRYQSRSNVAGFLLNPVSPSTPVGSSYIFLRKGLLSISSPLFVPGARYYLGENGAITPSPGSVVYPNALVEVGTARDAYNLMVDISLPLLGISDYPLGTLRPLIPGDEPFSGYLVCDGTTVHQDIDWPQFYAYGIQYNSQNPTSPIITSQGAPGTGTFIVNLKTDPATGTPYQVAAYTPDYEPLTSIVNRLSGAGTISGSTVSIDVSAFLSAGMQWTPTLTVDQIIATLYIGSKEYKPASWTLDASNILTADISNLSGVSGQPYVLHAYRPEVLARYQETTQILSTVNTGSGYAINSTALVNYLANDGAAHTLVLGNDTAGSIVKILGQIQFGDNSSIDGLSICGPISVKTDAGAQALSIDNVTGNVLVSTAQSYPTNAGHLVNKAYCDLHGVNTTVAVAGSFINGAWQSNSGVHGIKMGVGGLFDADMLDERHVGGWGWVGDLGVSQSGNMPLARSAWIPEITNAGVMEVGKQLNFYNASVASKPAVSAITTSLQVSASAPYLQISNPNSTLQAVQIGMPTNSNAVNLISVGNALLVTNDSQASATPTSFAPVKAAGFLTVSTIKAKQNVVPFSRSGLALINETPIFEYELKTEPGRPRAGFIAEYTDSLMSGRNHNENDLGTTLGVALKAIQELSSDNEMLRKRIEDLEARLSASRQPLQQ